MAIVEHDVAQVAEHRAGATLPKQLRVGIGRGAMRGIRAALAVEIDRRIPRIVRRLPRRLGALEALETRPGFQLRAVHGEVLVGQHSGLARLRHHRVKERRGDLAGEQPLAILTERGRRPDRVVHPEPHEPAKQHAVVDLLHQQPLAAYRVEGLQQQGPQQLLGRNRGPADLRVHRRKPRRQRGQGLVRQAPDRPQRVVGPHPLLRRQIAEHIAGLLVRTAHPCSSLVGGRMVVRPVEACRSPAGLTFSAAC